MKTTESLEQRAFVKWCRMKKIAVISVPNGFFSHTKDKKFYGQITKLKAEGMSKGFPDLVVMLKGKVIFIEMKNITGGKTSQEQKDWIGTLIGLDHIAVVCNGCDEAINVVEAIND